MSGMAKWLGGLLACTAASAGVSQVPAPSTQPRRMPPVAPGPDLATAQRAAQAAMTACLPVKTGVAVLDTDGGDKLVVVADGAPSRWADLARRKAMTVITFGRASSATAAAAKTDPALDARLHSDPKLVWFGGGIPVMKDGKMLGAIAVSGAPSSQTDEVCAKAGLAVLQGG